MAARICFTTVSLLLAALGFLDAAPSPFSSLNPFGILFLILSGAIWFGWEVIQDAFAYRDEIRGLDRRTDLMLIRAAPFLGQRPRR